MAGISWIGGCNFARFGRMEIILHSGALGVYLGVELSIFSFLPFVDLH